MRVEDMCLAIVLNSKILFFLELRVEDLPSIFRAHKIVRSLVHAGLLVEGARLFEDLWLPTQYYALGFR